MSVFNLNKKYELKHKIQSGNVRDVYMALSFHEDDAKTLFKNHKQLLDKLLITFPDSTLYSYKNAHLSIYIENEQSSGLSVKNIEKAMLIKDQDKFFNFCAPLILCSQKIEYCYLTIKAEIENKEAFNQFWTEIGGKKTGIPHISLLRINGDEMQGLDKTLHPVDNGYPDMTNLNDKFYDVFSPSSKCTKLRVKEAHLEFANTPGAKDGTAPISDRMNYIDFIYEDLILNLNGWYTNNSNNDNICPKESNIFE